MLLALFNSAATFACSCCSTRALSAWPGAQNSQSNDSVSSQPIHSSDSWPNSSTINHGRGGADSLKAHGCNLALNAKSGPKGIELISSSGNSDLDFRIQRESDFLGTAFGVRPGLSYFNDRGAPNALATPDTFLGKQDGSVLFGIILAKLEMQANINSLGGGLMIILAHEWAHIYQFKRRLKAPVPKMELQADFMAGWYLTARIINQIGFYGTPAQQQGNLEILVASQSLFNKGDYQFNNPQHHGTPKQRYRAMELGMQLALEGNSNLDQIFEISKRHTGLV